MALMSNNQTPNTDLMVKGLPLEITDETLHQLFAQYGTVNSAKCLPVAQGKTAKAAFVTVGSLEEATWIVQNVSGNVPSGLTTPIDVIYATPRDQRAGGKGGGGGMGKGMGGMKGDNRWSPYGGMDGGMGGMMQQMMGMMGGMAKGWGGGGKAGGAMAGGYGGGGGWGKGGAMSGGMGMGGAGKGGAPVAKMSENKTPNTDLMVKGLPLGTTDESLHALFSQYGTVKSAKCLPVAHGKTAMAAFVSVGTLEEATWIVQNVSGNVPQGLTNQIDVIYATPREQRAGGKGGGGGGSWW